VWELSQNIDRFTDTTPFGITGCITPTGVPYVTVRGGPMIGLEALAMQGLPIERLLLTREHQRQLQDLAGNAMSTTVVGAAMLGALIVGYKALGPGYGEKMVIDVSRDVSKNICGTDHLVEDVLDLATFEETPVISILRDAGRSSRLCLCEGRALMTSNRLQQCKQCYHTTCLKCGGNPKHDYALLPTDLVASRLPPGRFENSLKDTLPMRVRVVGISGEILESLKNTSGIEVKDWAQLTRAIEPALGAELRFHSLKRAEAWTVFYESPTSRMELVLDSRQAEWRLFAKPSKRENVNSNVRKLLARPFARMRPVGNNLVEGKWQFCFPTELIFRIKIEGRGKAVRSWESKLGLQEPKFADKKLWSMLHLSVEKGAASRLDMDISGDYKFLPNCGTAAGCLHKKVSVQEGGESDTALFLFLDPSRYGNPVEDYFVFSTDVHRYNYGEQRPIVARVDPRWRPLHSFSEQTVKCTADGQWIDIESAKFKTIESNARTTYATPSSDMNIEFMNSSCSAANAILFCKVPLPEGEEVGWTKGEWIEVDKLSERTVFSSFAWLTARVRHIKDFDTWRVVDIPRDFDRCQNCAPSPPKVKWRRVEKEKLEPFEDPQQAAPYERALKNRPPPFLTHVRIDDNDVGLLKIGLNISSLIHRAFSNLPQRGSLSDVELSWRLTTDYIPPPRVVLPKFSLRSNKKDPSCDQPPHFRMALRPEQLRSLGWMRRQEAEDVAPFMEEEIEEALLPHLGWRAEGRATKNITIRGGVLADQVGYGKTATTLGLIDSQFPGEGKSLEDIPGKIPLKATLIIVPHTLLNQWGNEIKKFLGSTYNVVSIKDTRQLSTHKVSDFQKADIIITNWSVLNNENYYTKLAHFAALPDMPSGTGRAFGAWYTYALQRVAEHVDVLREDGAYVLEQTLKAKLKSFEDDEELVKYVPSKRLRGTAYRKAQQAKAEEARNTKPGGKRKAEEISLSDNEPPLRKGHSDPFSLRNANVRKDWKRMQNPLFQMFHFNRLVVDEYTYVGGNDHTSITSLQANVRWVLSGTPPLGDFADVKTISVFLGINLGIDDDAVGVIQAHNIKAMGKERTGKRYSLSNITTVGAKIK
jgi:SNF2-related domain